MTPLEFQDMADFVGRVELWEDIESLLRGGAGRIRGGHGGLRGASRTLRVVRRRDDGPDDQRDIAGYEEGEDRGFEGLKEFFTLHYSLVRRAKGVELSGWDFKCVEPGFYACVQSG